MIDPKRVLRALAEHWTLLEPLCERFDTGTLSLVELRNQLSTQLPEGSPADITALLDPESAKAGKAARGAAKPASGKRARKVKQYKNPNTGEVIETKGGNHKTLKEWKAKWGAATVEGWATLLG